MPTLQLSAGQNPSLVKSCARQRASPLKGKKLLRDMSRYWLLRGHLQAAAAAAGPIMCMQHTCSGTPAGSQEQLCSVMSGNNYSPARPKAHSGPGGSDRQASTGLWNGCHSSGALLEGNNQHHCFGPGPNLERACHKSLLWRKTTLIAQNRQLVEYIHQF